MFEGPVHFIAAIRKLAGEVGRRGEVKTSAALCSKNEDLGQLDTLAGWLLLEGSDSSLSCAYVICAMQITYAAAKPKISFIVTCERGNLELERVPGKYLLRVQCEGEDPAKVTEIPFDGVAKEMEAFLEAVKVHKGGESQNRKTGFVDQNFPDLSAAEGYKDVLVLMALFRAAETKRVVTVPLDELF